MPKQELARNTSKRKKTHHPTHETSITVTTHHNNNLTIHNNTKPTKEHSIDHPDLTYAQNTNKGRNTLTNPYPIEVVKPVPKPYKLRPPKPQRAPSTPRKRKIHTHNPQEGNPHPLATIPQTQPTIRHDSVA